jgi:acyl-CoA reductase-like NAD-dependent aldehyde dehydrogenase
MEQIGLLIAGRDVAATGGAVFERRNPITGAVATRAAAAAVGDAIDAVNSATGAFAAWSELGPNARRAFLTKAADAILARGDEFAAAMKAETGATEGWARFNISLASSMLREAGAMTTQIKGEIIPSDKPGCIAMAVRQPAGVVLGIAPWNAPIILGVRAVATPLACGNTVVLKASELCPKTHYLIGQCFVDAGLPAGAVNVVSNGLEDAGEIVGALIDHVAVKRINFTGSTKVGRIIARRAADNLKPVLLELGGKAPFIILADADLDEAVKAASFGAFFNQGQICMSTERIIVHEAVAEAFMDKFVAKIGTLIAGDPLAGSTPLGSVVDARAVEHVQALIDDAVAKGASLHRAAETAGTLMSAAALDHVTPEMRAYGEESFGPVTTVIRVKDDEDAIRVANDSEYGLSAALFTRDIARGLTLAKRIQSGICHINGPTVHDEAQMPFGGVKASGYGRFGGSWGVAEFTDLRWITIETRPGHYPI